MAEWLTPCRRCGLLIAWDTTKNGKRIPIDPDGRIHFSRCKGSVTVKPKEDHT